MFFALVLGRESAQVNIDRRASVFQLLQIAHHTEAFQC